MKEIDTTNKETIYKTFYSTYAWRKLRMQVIKRDHYECVRCKQAGKLTTKRLEVDHIKEVADFPALAYDMNNLRTLCKDCHNKRHNRYCNPYERKTYNDEVFEWN